MEGFEAFHKELCLILISQQTDLERAVADHGGEDQEAGARYIPEPDHADGSKARLCKQENRMRGNGAGAHGRDPVSVHQSKKLAGGSIE